MDKPILIKDLGMIFATQVSKNKQRYGIYQCPFCKNEFKANSLKACLVVYKELLNKYKNKRLALKEYKGVTSKENLYLIDRVIETEKGLR